MRTYMVREFHLAWQVDIDFNFLTNCLFPLIKNTSLPGLIFADTYNHHDEIHPHLQENLVRFGIRFFKI